jgi:Protein of unknown function (DUF4079)
MRDSNLQQRDRLPIVEALTNPLHVRSGLAVSLASLVTTPQTVYAANAVPDWGLFAGRTASLLHPLTMGSLFVFTLYTAYVGFQWRWQRTLGDEIAMLQKKVPPLNLDSRQILPLEAQIAALMRERKEISSKGPRDQHFSQGALLACIEVSRELHFYASFCCSANQMPSLISTLL